MSDDRRHKELMAAWGECADSLAAERAAHAATRAERDDARLAADGAQNLIDQGAVAIARVEQERDALREEVARLQKTTDRAVEYSDAQGMTIAEQKIRETDLQAKFGRAVAALLTVVRHAAYDCPAHQVVGFDPKCEACVAKNYGNPMATPEVIAILADPDSAAVGEAWRELEAAIEAARPFANMSAGFRDALAAVDARRGSK